MNNIIFNQNIFYKKNIFTYEQVVCFNKNNEVRLFKITINIKYIY